MRVLLVALMLLLAVPAYAAPTAVLQAAPCKSVSGSTNLIECTYEVPTVADAAVTEFSLVTDYSYGQITEFIVTNASTDFDFWFAKSAGQTKATAVLSKDIFISYEAQNIAFSPELTVGRNFVNREGARLIYFWMDNNAGGALATGINYLSVTFGR